MKLITYLVALWLSFPELCKGFLLAQVMHVLSHTFISCAQFTFMTWCLGKSVVLPLSLKEM
jgi:hypothetical protein